MYILYTNKIICKRFHNGFFFFLYLIDTNAAYYQPTILKFIFLCFTGQYKKHVVLGLHYLIESRSENQTKIGRQAN